MGRYLDRTNKQQTIILPPGRSSITPVQDDAPVYARLKTALSYMIAKGQGVQGSRSMTMKIITKIMNEAMEDMRDSGLAPEIASMYMKQLGTMVNWVADGTWDESVPMPEDFTV
jgi:hypothetical protein